MASTKSILRKIGADTNHEELENERLKQNYEQIRINDDKFEEERIKMNLLKLMKDIVVKQKVVKMLCL